MKLRLLNEDIYYVIFKELDGRSDVSTCMRSSRAFYAIGASRLLRMGVYIYSDDELVSFCGFMKRNFLDVHQDASQLRELTLSFNWNRDEPDSDNSEDGIETGEDDIDTDECKFWGVKGAAEYDEANCDEDGTDSDEDGLSDCEDMETLRGAPLLVSVLPCLTNLRCLAMEHCEPLLKYDDRLIAAFAALTTLRELHITGFGLRTYDFITNLRSGLTQVDIDCGYTVDKLPITPRDGSGMVDPLHMLYRHRHTLEDVTIHLGDVTVWLLQQAPRSDRYEFAHVHTLSLSRCRVLERKTITNAFPNISAFDAFELETSNFGFPKGTRLSVEWVRNHNRFDLKQWKELEYVYADVTSVYMLALKCSVGRLDVVCLDHEWASLHRLLAVLADIRPARLVLQVGYWETPHAHHTPALTPEVLGQFLAGMQEPVVSKITHFGLDVGLAKHREPFRRKVRVPTASRSCLLTRLFHRPGRDQAAAVQPAARPRLLVQAPLRRGPARGGLPLRHVRGCSLHLNGLPEREAFVVGGPARLRGAVSGDAVISHHGPSHVRARYSGRRRWAARGAHDRPGGGRAAHGRRRDGAAPPIKGYVAVRRGARERELERDGTLSGVRC